MEEELEGCPWYHGPITRIAAELGVARDGDFLVRDCISSPGELVLTCRSKGQVLHFRLNRVPDPEAPTAAPMCYQFEGECFRSVSALLAHHVSSGEPISTLSGAVVVAPVARGPDTNMEQNTSADNGCDGSFRRGEIGDGDAARNTYFFGEEPKKAIIPSSSSSSYQKWPSFSSFKPSRKKNPPPPPPRNRNGSGGGQAAAAEKRKQFEGIKEMKGSIGRSYTSQEDLEDDFVLVPRAQQNKWHSLPRTSKSSEQQNNFQGQHFAATLDRRIEGGSTVKNVSSKDQSEIKRPNPVVPRPLPPPPEEERKKKRKPILPPPLPERKNIKSKEVAFPRDIELPTSTLPPPPVEKDPPALIRPDAKSETYDVPKVGDEAKSCLTEQQVSGGAFYDQPRILGKFEKKPFKGVPPPPPSRACSLSDNNGDNDGSSCRPVTIVRLSYSARQGDAAENNNSVGNAGDSTSVVSEEVSNTDTSYLEHRELTPLLSSEGDCCAGEDSAVFDSGSEQPGEPFPSGLPAGTSGNNNNSNCNNNNNNNQSTTTTSTSSYSQTSSLLDSSPESATTTAIQINMSKDCLGGKEGGLPQIGRGEVERRKEEGKQKSHGSITVEEEVVEEESTRRNVGHEDNEGSKPIHLTGEKERIDAEGVNEDDEDAERSTTSPPTSPKSLFDMTSFCQDKKSFFFPGQTENKPLSPSALAAAQAALLESTPRDLAAELTRQDVRLLSIDLPPAEESRYEGLPGIRSGLHLLTLVDGRQLREDVMERHLCLRLFALVTVMGASSFARSVLLLARWVGVARECAGMGNGMALSALVAAMRSPELQRLEGLWTVFAGEHEEEDRILKEVLYPLVDSLNCLSEKEENTCGPIIENSEIEKTLLIHKNEMVVPNVIPFLSGCRDVKDRRTFRQVFREVFSDQLEEQEDLPEDPANFPPFAAHLIQMSELLGNLEALRDLAQEKLPVTAEKNGDPKLSELCRCEFHMRLLWGSASASALGSDERHARFTKVVRALAHICAKIERDVLNVVVGGGESKSGEERL